MSTTITVGGVRYEHFRSVGVARSVEDAVSTFTVTAPLRWKDEPNPIRAYPGAPVVIEDDGDALLAGYVDEPNIDTDTDDETVEIPGRSKTGDLVDCDACHVDAADLNDIDAKIYPPRQFRNMTPIAIMKAIAAPFLVDVEYLPPVPTVNDPVDMPIPSYGALRGEKAFDAIERLARSLSMLVMDDGEGRLVLTRITDTAAIVSHAMGPLGGGIHVIEHGVNTLASSGSFPSQQRFSHYIARGQRPGTAADYGDSVVSQAGRARDPEVLRRRVLFIDADEATNTARLTERAAWEAATRAGRGVDLAYDMVGWRWPDGFLIEPGEIVHVIDKKRAVDAMMLLTSAAWTLDGEVKMTTVAVAPVGGYEMIAPEKRAAAGKKTITAGSDFGVLLTVEDVAEIKREAGQ
jgi:prophage tail gpP-like protein